jgi:hypothetical protein
MDDDRTPHEPDQLAPEQLDEILSAELDGELAAAARDLGASVEAITARVNATPGADARRGALAAARDLLAAPPEIDELLAQRLRTKAIRAAAEQHTARELDRRRRRRQMFVGAGGIAAAAVAVVALAGGLSHNGGSSTASEKAAGNAAPAADTTESTGRGAPTSALGAFSDKRKLADAALVHTAATADGSTAYAANQTPSGNRAFAPATTTAGTPKPGAASAPSRDAGSGHDSLAIQKAATAGSTRPAGSACPTPSGIAPDDTLVLRATATLSGKPVIVFVFSGRGEHAIEIEDTHCTLVDIEMR